MHIPRKPILDRSLYDGRLRPPEFYRNLGFRSGLEVHQQLLTERKLFCRCPAGRYSTHHDAVLLRHMRPTLSELGEYDGAALMEFKTKKEVVYLLDSRSVCTYEMDDTPPFEPNREAIEIALRITLLLGCQVVGEAHVARKQYLDGSIPTGFQRTAILGVEGAVPFPGEPGRSIGIYQLSFEEDACREVEDRGHRVIFRTDRLSMPLIEVVTKPDLCHPLEVAAAGWRIGDLLRSTRQVRRGIGSVRQDVNVSIEGGTRVEVKGVARIPLFPKITHNEALRQAALLEIRDWLVRRKVTADNVHGGSVDVTQALATTTCPGLRAALASGHRIRAVVLRGFQAPLLELVQPCIPFAQEFSGRVRVIACLDAPSNLFVRGAPLGFGLHRHHRACSGSAGAAAWRPPSAAPGLCSAAWGPGPVSHDPERGPTTAEWAVIAAAAGARPVDGVLVVFGSPADLDTAEQEIIARARETLLGVPNETRMPFASGTTDFERILPGADRMYPDTDLPPIEIRDEMIAAAQAALPELPWVREERYAAFGLSAEAARQISTAPLADHFDEAVAQAGLAPKDAYRLFVCEAQRARRAGLAVDTVPRSVWSALARSWARREFHREALPDLLRRMSESWRKKIALEAARDNGRSDRGAGAAGGSSRDALRSPQAAVPRGGTAVAPELSAEEGEAFVASVLTEHGIIRPPAPQRWTEAAVRAAAHDASVLLRAVRGAEKDRKAGRYLTGRLRRRFGGLLAGRDIAQIAEDAVREAAAKSRTPAPTDPVVAVAASGRSTVGSTPRRPRRESRKDAQ